MTKVRVASLLGAIAAMAIFWVCGADAADADSVEGDPCPGGGAPVVDPDLGQVGCFDPVPQPPVVPPINVPTAPPEDGEEDPPGEPVGDPYASGKFCDAYGYYAGLCKDENGDGIPDAWEPVIDNVPSGPQQVPQDATYVGRDMCKWDPGLLKTVVPVSVNTCSLCVCVTWGSNVYSPNCDPHAPQPHCIVKVDWNSSFVERRLKRFQCEVVWPEGSEVNR